MASYLGFFSYSSFVAVNLFFNFLQLLNQFLCSSLEVYEIYDNLPEGMREKFRRVMEQHGERIVPYGQRRARQQSPASTLNPARPIKKTGERQQYPISKVIFGFSSKHSFHDDREVLRKVMRLFVNQNIF